MIGILDTWRLAIAKLRYKKVYTTVVILISSLLFAILFSLLIMFYGIKQSVTDFNNQGLNSRIFVMASPVPVLPSGYINSDKFINYIQDKHQAYLNDKVAEAERLGIDYDPDTELSPIIVQTIPGQGVVNRPNLASAEVQNLMAKYISEHPAPGLEDLKSVATPYHPSNFIEMTYMSLYSLSLMPDGQEVFSPTENQQKSLSLFQQPAYVMSDSILDPLMFKDMNIDKSAIPIVVSYKMAQSILGLPNLDNPSTQQKIDRINELYTKAKGYEVTLCYRNSTSSNLVNEAINQLNADTEADNYMEPKLVYALPELTSCGAVQVSKDSRTTAEKAQQAAKNEFDSQFSFGIPVEPAQSKVTLQIVGLSPDIGQDPSLTFGDLLSGLVSSSLGAEVAIPVNMLGEMNDGVAKDLIESQIDNKLLAISRVQDPFIVEFSNAEDARQFISEQSCKIGEQDNVCTNGDKKFTITNWGNNSVAIEDLTQKATGIIQIAFLAVVGLSVIILSIMIGKIISDSRTETAVFRAIGAKRSDIVSIYSTYMLIVCVGIFMASIILGVVIVLAIQSLFADQATALAKLLFNSVNTDLTFNFIGLDMESVGLLALAVLIAGLLSLALPLIRNILRPPIKDLRE